MSTFAEDLSAVMLAHGDRLYYCTRFGKEAADEFAVDMETNGAEYVIVPVAAGKAFTCVGSRQPTRTGKHERWFAAKVLAMAVRSEVETIAAGKVRLSEGWAIHCTTAQAASRSGVQASPQRSNAMKCFS